jgi:hypothetical protein
MRKLCLLGTYVKRRCNLKLIRLGMGMIDPMDMRISLDDMVRAANNMNIRASVNWNPSGLLPSDFYLYVLDTLERVLEYEDFGLKEIRIESIPDGVSLEIHRFEEYYSKPVYQDADGQYPQVMEELPDGYRITLKAGGDRHV